MEPKNYQKNYTLLKKMSTLPGKIVTLHGRDNVTEFVLHDLAGKLCFNFSKAGYFVDNPDFNHFKGVAGYCNSQSFEHADFIWENPEEFTRHMLGSPFNKQVRNVARQSPRRGCIDAQKIVDDVAQELDMTNPHYFCWNLKHYNHGLFIFENGNGQTDWDQEDLMNGLHLLSMCPIF